MVDVNGLRVHIYDIVGAVYVVHKELGAGLNEYCYQEGLAMELADRGIPFEREVSFHPLYKGRMMNAEYRVDFICKGNIVVECKAVSELAAVHRAQLFNYMRLLKLPCGILANFYPPTAMVERYFYDAETGQILTVNGTPFEARR